MSGRALLIALTTLILVAVLSGLVLMRRAADGAVVRTVSLSTSPWAAALDQQTGRLFMVNRSNFGFVGNGQGSRSALSSISGGPTGVGGIYAYSSGGTISIIDTRGRSAVHTVSVGDDPRAVALDPVQGLAYVTNDDDANVSVLDTHTGALVRSTRVGARPHALVSVAAAHRVFVVNSSDATVSVLDSRTARVVGLVHVPAAVDYSGAAVDSRTNRIFIVGDGLVSVLDAHSGALLGTASLERDRQQRLPQEITQVAVDEQAGRVYALVSGYISVLDAASGRLLRSIPAGPNAAALALDPRQGHLLLAATGTADADGTIHGTGSLQVLDPGTGQVLHTISLGVAPSAVIVDARADHVLVADGGGAHRVTDPWAWLPGGVRSHLPFLPSPSSGTSTVQGSVITLKLSGL